MKLRKTVVTAVAFSSVFALAVQAQAGEINTFPGSNVSIGSVEVVQGALGPVVSAYKEGHCFRSRRSGEVRCRWGRQTYFAPVTSPLNQFANLLGGAGNFFGGVGNLAAGFRHLPDSTINVNNGSASISQSEAASLSRVNIR